MNEVDADLFTLRLGQLHNQSYEIPLLSLICRINLFCWEMSYNGAGGRGGTKEVNKIRDCQWSGGTKQASNI